MFCSGKNLFNTSLNGRSSHTLAHRAHRGCSTSPRAPPQDPVEVELLEEAIHGGVRIGQGATCGFLRASSRAAAVPRHAGTPRGKDVRPWTAVAVLERRVKPLHPPRDLLGGRLVSARARFVCVGGVSGCPEGGGRVHRRNTPLTHGYLPISRSRRGSRRHPTPRAACSSQRAVRWLCRAPSTSHRGPTWWWRRDPQSPPSSSHPHCVQGDALDSGLGGGDPCLRAAVYAFARTNCRARALSESCFELLLMEIANFKSQKSNSPVACYKAASRLHQGEGRSI